MEAGKMKFYEDIDQMFKPLIDYVEENFQGDILENLVGQYMYMGHDDEKTFYKHFGNREYFNIKHDGSTEGKIQDWRRWA
jgi:hypothetical protein